MNNPEPRKNLRAPPRFARPPKPRTPRHPTGYFQVKTRALLVVPVVAFLMMVVFASASSAKDEPGISSGSPVMQGPAPQSSIPSGEFTGRGHHRPSLAAIMEKLGITDE
jgi:hypothetical protein